MTVQQSLFLGIDGGGSKCKAVLMNAEQQVLGQGISGPANPLRGFDQATHSIVESAKQALADAKLPADYLSQLHVAMGLAGVNLAYYFEQMQNWQHPFASCQLTTDLAIACYGAHQGGSGAVIITGTGSCGIVQSESNSTILGGYGFPHGDQGSGAWFGLQAVTACLLAIDGLAQPTMMLNRVLKQVNCDSAEQLAAVVANQNATFYAKLANIVFDCAEQNDQVAQDILAQGINYLNHLALQLISRASCDLALIGGLSHRIIPHLSKVIQPRIISAKHSPEVGACLWGMAQMNNQHLSKVSVL